MTFPRLVSAAPTKCFALDANANCAIAFARPALPIHGDIRSFPTEPLKNSDGRQIPDTNTLTVYADTPVHGVRVLVAPDQADVTGIAPIIIPGRSVGSASKGIHRSPFGSNRRKAVA